MKHWDADIRPMLGVISDLQPMSAIDGAEAGAVRRVRARRGGTQPRTAATYIESIDQYQ